MKQFYVMVLEVEIYKLSKIELNAIQADAKPTNGETVEIHFILKKI